MEENKTNINWYPRPHGKSTKRNKGKFKINRYSN